MVEALYCVLCGLDFEPIAVHDPDEIDWDEPDMDETPWWADTFLDSKIIAKEQVQWMSELNVIGPKNNYPFFSEAENPFSALMHSATKQVHVHRQEPTAKIPGYPNPESTDGDWRFFSDLFPIHVACSKILQTTLSRRLEQPHDNDLPTTLTQIHEILAEQDCRDRDPSYVCWSGPESANLGFTMGISWPHGYFGVEQFWGDGFEIERDEGWEYFCADPLNIITPDTLLPLTPALLQLLEPIRQQDTPKPLPATQNTPIVKLPSELLAEIMVHLSTASILSLHRTCRDLSMKIPLTQHFWCEQLLTGKLVPYIWSEDIDIQACLIYNASLSKIKHENEEEQCSWDWERLCKLLMKEHYVPGRDQKDEDEVKLEALPLGIRNRRRICAVAKQIRK